MGAFLSMMEGLAAECAEPKTVMIEATYLKGKPRTTTWLGIEHGFGIRHYATDRNVYKAESWGYRLENTNPCRAVRLNRKRKCERFLSRAELERLGEVLARMRASDDAVRPIAAAHVRQPRRDE
ncbi:hypothetical protein SAMN02927924_03011 [Sphingobium faniae]|nr:hypothetical protein SAMN02927924_03011 [Sphingobium faniae]